MSLPKPPQPASVPAEDRSLCFPTVARWAMRSGEPDGSPVLLLCTSSGSRLLCPDLPATVAAGVRLLTVDRPGYGRSDPDPPGMARWVADTGALVDHLRLERFGLVGWSGDGQFALAAAAGLPGQVGVQHGLLAGRSGRGRRDPGGARHHQPAGRPRSPRCWGLASSRSLPGRSACTVSRPAHSHGDGLGKTPSAAG